MRRIAIVSLKGGVGKTTTAAALAVGLARSGARVLAIDCDPQANASWTLLGGQGAEAPTIADVLMRRAATDEAIRPTPTPGLDLLPADSSLGGVNVALAQELGRDSRLRSALAGLDSRYDYLIADTGPQLSTLLVNALVAVDEVITPLDPGIYAVVGLVELQGVIGEVRDAYNPGLRLAGLALTKTSRNNVVRDIEAELRARFGDLVFKATVPLAAAFEAACTRGTTILDHAPKSAGAIAYHQLIGEIIDHGRAKNRGRGAIGIGPGTGGPARAAG